MFTGAHRVVSFPLVNPPPGDQGLSFVEGNAESLPVFEDASFDSYTVAFGIRNVTDRDAALREAYRVLKPGGRWEIATLMSGIHPRLDYYW